MKSPLMLTGGFRSLEGMNSALASNACDVIGLARSLALQPNFSNDLLSGKNTVSQVKPLTTGNKKLDKTFPLEIIWYTEQLHRMGNRKPPKASLSVWSVIFKMISSVGIQSLKRVRAK